MKTIKKEITINAPKEKVWHILVEENFNKLWMEEFFPGTRADTDWIEGHSVKFTDGSGSGIVGKITAKRPYEYLEFTYEGQMVSGQEEYESEMARKIKGTVEHYTLSEIDGATKLAISCDMDDSYYDEMATAWDRAIKKIDELATSV